MKHLSARSIATLTLSSSFFGSLILGQGLAQSDAKQPTYAETVHQLQQAEVPVRQLGSAGRVAVTPAAGRIIGLAFAENGENLLWTNPLLTNTELVKKHPEKLVGGPGGDRLWFGPELAYHWEGVPNWETFANYTVPSPTDPGSYQFAKTAVGSIALHSSGELTVRGTDRRVGFDINRSFRLVAPPLNRDDPLMKGVDFVGVETSNHLKLSTATHEGQIDLWHLLQVPVGSVLIVPRKSSASAELAKPLSYGQPGAWQEKADHIRWHYQGKANAKFGLSAAAVTGRTAVLRRGESGRWILIVRQFPVDAQARYCDHPHGVPRDDQAVQAWDGYGFGEMEYHSPALDAQRGPRERQESDQIWAFGGSAQAIEQLARKLLGINISDLVSG